MHRCLVIAVCAALAGCMSLGRVASYDDGLQTDANFTLNGRKYSAAIHPAQDTLLIRPALSDGVTIGVLQGATLGLVGRHGGYQEWLRIGTHFLRPLGCEVHQMDPVDEYSGYWEFTWRCPPGVDLRNEMRAQRDALRRGEPFSPPGP